MFVFCDAGRNALAQLFLIASIPLQTRVDATAPSAIEREENETKARYAAALFLLFLLFYFSSLFYFIFVLLFLLFFFRFGREGEGGGGTHDIGKAWRYYPSLATICREKVGAKALLWQDARRLEKKRGIGTSV